MSWHVMPLLIGFTVGAAWTLFFGPWLNRVQGDPIWFICAVQAVGVFVMAVLVCKYGNLTPITLLATMIYGGLGMFAVKVGRAGWKQCSSR